MGGNVTLRSQKCSTGGRIIVVATILGDSRKKLTEIVSKRTMDLSLSDALTDSGPQPGPEGLVERDFVTQLEAETFDDQVGETVGKTDYIPLLDNDDTRADADPALENGEQDGHGAQKPGSKVTPGGRISAPRPEPQGEVRPNSTDQRGFGGADFLSGSISDHTDPWSSQPNNPAQTMDTSLTGGFSGFSQPVMGLNVDIGAAPLSADRPPSIAEPQTPPSQTANTPRDMSAGALGDGWPDQACIPTDLPFTPSVSTVISRHASHLAASPEEAPDSGWPHRESSAAGEEREGYDRKQQQQKKKKKRKPRDDLYDLGDVRGQPEAQAENNPPEGHHRVSPRRDRERTEGGWEREDQGRVGGRGKKSKSRKKLPEEWGVTAEPFVSSSGVQLPEGVLDQLVPQHPPHPAHLNTQPPESPYSSMALSPATEEFYPEGLIPSSLTQDLLSLTSPPSPPPALGLKSKDTFPVAPCPADPFTTSYQDLLMDTENANMGGADGSFSMAFPLASPHHQPAVRVMFDPDPSVQDVHMKDDMSFSSAHQPECDLSPLVQLSELTATAPPFSPSDSPWLLHDSLSNSGNTPGRSLPLGLAFDTPSPAPLRSPKTGPEFHPREGKEAKSPSQKIPNKPRSSSSSSSSTKSPTSPGNSGLNPAAKPFFPSFADPSEPPTVVVAAPVSGGLL
ncbi:hypothetical protein UPYG_G00071250 [Umbra pygmaea]|uniref:Microtubule-associated protein 4 n=1 Tax=Umbra pygmaea TaxID=75934 RepID=A0ABD0XBL8_UMBPY